ncbi:MAG: hypothetical protein EA357_06270 [Micavibrio sp.]|nr:MAG: hypothetical protein EA357_06270 [Micavibrio sp.]
MVGFATAAATKAADMTLLLPQTKENIKSDLTRYLIKHNPDVDEEILREIGEEYAQIVSRVDTHYAAGASSMISNAFTHASDGFFDDGEKPSGFMHSVSAAFSWLLVDKFNIRTIDQEKITSDLSVKYKELTMEQISKITNSITKSLAAKSRLFTIGGAAIGTISADYT